MGQIPRPETDSNRPREVLIQVNADGCQDTQEGD
jgi:hypothetical protein